MLKLLKEAKNKSLNSKIMGVKLGRGESNRVTRKSRKWGEGNYFFRGPGLPKKRCLVFTHNKSTFKNFCGGHGPHLLCIVPPLQFANGTKSKIYSDHNKC